MVLYKDLVLDEERALYGITGAIVEHCTFAGEADGESALKETDGLCVKGCDFRLRYPMWHMKNSELSGSVMSDTCRAALWYCENVRISYTEMGGIKALRECKNISITDCKAVSPEFGWFCNDISLKNTEINGEYPFLHTCGLTADALTLNGKYSFQYLQNATLSGCVLNTKDAFWHAKNVTVTDSLVKGEYLAWYSENVTFIRCRIEGTQPLCYCKNLTLIDCEMVNCDLSFEKSEVKASVTGYIESVKNPICGSVTADKIGEIIDEYNTPCVITQRHSGS